MKQSDIFLFPSWRDELGLVLCEAVSQGVAVLARKSGAQDELVLDDINGRLFDFSSTPEEWRASILEMANDTDKLITYKQNSLVLAKKMLDPTNFASTLSLAFSVND
jgi:glycosyltransferase involved in cell wall biosynthesis